MDTDRIAWRQRIAASIFAPVEFAIAVVAGLLLLLLWLLPWGAAVRLARAGACVLACALPGIRRVAMINLRRAYGPSMTRAAARRAAFCVFANMGQTVAEGIQVARRIRRGAMDGGLLCEMEDPDLARRLLSDPRPKIFVTGHLGGWEAAAMMTATHTPGLKAVARRVDNRYVDALVRRFRAFGGLRNTIDKQGAARATLIHLRAGHSVLMLADENAGRGGLFVEFFGRPASATRLPAVLAVKTGAPIVLGTAVRTAARPGTGRCFRFRLALFEPAQAPRDHEQHVQALTQAIATQWERWVRDDPMQWRWIHWRWKARPDGRDETYTRRDLDASFAAPAIGAAGVNEPIA